jgi:hypothetical protein
MSLNDIDKTRASRTEDELRALVEAIYTSPAGTQETKWLEWKNGLDVGAVEGRFAVGKAIIGFANRAVAQAQLACEGIAYMVVGVEPGAAAGVPNFDHASRGQKIKTYADGPRWTPHYVEFNGVTVLVVVVEAPRAGDPIHTLQKEFTKDKTSHKAGTVFHRGAAHTEPAGPKEMAMLQERLLQGAQQPDLSLDLVASADPLIRLEANKEQVQDWLQRHEGFVRANSGQPPPSPPPPPKPPSSTPAFPYAGLSNFDFGVGIGSLFGSFQYAKPEDSEEFERRVNAYMSKVKKAIIEHLVQTVVRSDQNKVEFLVGNETDDAVTGVQMMVIVPSEGVLVYTRPPDSNLPRRLPRWPDPVRDRWSNVEPAMVPAHYDYDLISTPVVKKDDTYEITWNIGDLRPGERSDPRTITIVATPSAPDEIEIQLIARAMNRRRTAAEKRTLTVTSERWTIDDWLDPEPGK